MKALLAGTSSSWSWIACAVHTLSLVTNRCHLIEKSPCRNKALGEKRDRLRTYLLGWRTEAWRGKINSILTVMFMMNCIQFWFEKYSTKAGRVLMHMGMVVSSIQQFCVRLTSEWEWWLGESLHYVFWREVCTVCTRWRLDRERGRALQSVNWWVEIIDFWICELHQRLCQTNHITFWHKFSHPQKNEQLRRSFVDLLVLWPTWKWILLWGEL